MSATAEPEVDLETRLATWADDVGRRAARREALSRLDGGSTMRRARVLVYRVMMKARDDGVAATISLAVSRVAARFRGSRT